MDYAWCNVTLYIFSTSQYKQPYTGMKVAIAQWWLKGEYTHK